MTNQFELGNLLIETPSEWKNITDTVDVSEAPFTLAKDNGFGALQFSFAEYRSGELPSFTLSDLCDMRDEFAGNHGFLGAFDQRASKARIIIACASYHAGQDLVRVWYCSNGKDIVLATYLVEWRHQNDEIRECDGIISKLTFRTTP